MRTINENSFVSIITENVDKAIIIFCWASWNDKCDALWSVMDKLTNKYSEGVEFAHMDLSDTSCSKEYRDIYESLNVRGVPFIIAIKNVNVIRRRVIRRTTEFKDIEKVVRLLIHEKICEMTNASIINLSQKQRIEHDMKILTLRSLLK